MSSILNQEASFSDYTYKGQSLSSFADDQIVQLVIDGQDGAFAELYHRFNSDIYSYILRLVSNQGVAEDLLQEVFVAVWQVLDSFKRESSVKTWLFRIAHNKTMSWMRTYYRSQDVDQDETLDTAETTPPDVQTVLNWRADMLQEALHELSANHRAVVELFYFQGLSYAEISEIVRSPVGTIKSRMSHALQNLNGILTNMGVESSS